MKLGLRPTTCLTGLSLAGFIVFAMAAQGCTVELTEGPSDGGSLFDRDSGSTKPDAGPPGATDSCSRCLYAQCAPAHAACDTNRDCTGIYNCAIQPSANVRQCIEARPNGKPAYDGLYICDQRHACTTCADECSGFPVKRDCEKYPMPVVDAGQPPPPDAGPAPVDAAPPPPETCESCSATKCPSENAACAAGSQCKTFSDCVSTCAIGAPDKLDQCMEACEMVYPEGKAQAVRLSECSRTNCAICP